MVIWVVAALALGALPGAWHTLRHLDANIYNQVSNELVRFRVLRETSEDFGGDILLAAVAIPEAAAELPERVAELRDFGVLLAAELSQVGTAPDERHALASAGSDAALAGPWLSQVACRRGEELRGVLEEIAKAHPHALLRLEDVRSMGARFEPTALRARMKEFRKEAEGYDRGGLEFQRLLADPLKMSADASAALAARLQSSHPGSAKDDPEGFFLSPDRTLLLVLARPIRSATDLPFSKALMAACQRAENRAIEAFRKRDPAPGLTTALKGEAFGAWASGADADPDLHVGFTGLHTITVENEASLRWDILLNTLTAGLFVVGIYLLAYRRGRLAFDIILTLGLAILFSLAIIQPFHGQIGVLGAGFTSILIGMGEDYAVYLHNTYHQLRSEEGLPPEEALRRTMVRCGPSILSAALTAAVAFFAIATTHFRGLAELGLLAGLGLTLSAALMLSLFPALMLGSAGAGGTRVRPPISAWITALARLQATPRGIQLCLYAGLGVGGLAVALLLCGPAPGPDSMLGVRFDGEFGNLRSLRIQAIPLRDLVQKRFGLGFADVRVVVEANEEGAAFQAAERIAARLALHAGELQPSAGILDVVPSPDGQEQVLHALRDLDLKRCAGRFLTAAREEFGERAETEFKPFLDQLHAAQARLGSAKILRLADLLAGPLAPILLRFARLDGEGGAQRVRLVSYYFPLALDHSESWFRELARTVERDPEPESKVRVTAARMVGFELKASLFRDMAWITGIVGLAVALLLLLTYRSVLHAALAALPLSFAYLFVLAGVQVAQLAEWDFALNYVNLMVFPLLLGTGIDYGIYLVSDAVSARRPSLFRLVSETGMSVFVACLTTLAGFGSMIFSNYTGLISFGWAALLGYAGALFGALIVLPAVLGCLGIGKEDGPPATTQKD